MFLFACFALLNLLLVSVRSLFRSCAISVNIRLIFKYRYCGLLVICSYNNWPC